jgi:hypothetical protein
MQHPPPPQTPPLGSNNYQYLHRPRPEDAALHITVRVLTRRLLLFLIRVTSYFKWNSIRFTIWKHCPDGGSVCDCYELFFFDSAAKIVSLCSSNFE